MALFSYSLKDFTPLELFAALHEHPYSLFLDSASADHPLSKYSYIVFHPFETIEAKNGRIMVTNREQQLSYIGDPFQALNDRLESYELTYDQSKSELPPFQGGAAGFFGYDLARNVERLPEKTEDHMHLPDMAIGLYDRVYAYDHEKQTGWFITHAKDESEAKAKLEHFKGLIEDVPAIEQQQNFKPDWRASHTQENYEADVQKVIDYIHAGDIFQANISQSFKANISREFNPFAYYTDLRHINPAPYGAYMNFGTFRIMSSSPERFLSVKDRKVETRPIKGTRPRSSDIKMDEINREALRKSSKDKAENIMIVDLLRNDLSKVCEDHSIEVEKLCELESFAGVHHLVSIVSGALKADQSCVDLLRACFPGGSISGAPKVRAMEIIEEIEPERRGPYCGAMGYIGFNGTMDTNIAIRTLVCDRKTLRFNVGGGIVADSVPADEYEETLAKAKSIFESFDHRGHREEESSQS